MGAFNLKCLELRIEDSLVVLIASNDGDDDDDDKDGGHDDDDDDDKDVDDDDDDDDDDNDDGDDDYDDDHDDDDDDNDDDEVWSLIEFPLGPNIVIADVLWLSFPSGQGSCIPLNLLVLSRDIENISGPYGDYTPLFPTTNQ